VESGDVSAQLELTDGAQARIQELQALSEKAEDGDQDARRELRRAVRESAPEVVARCADIARTYRWIVADTSSGRDLLVQEALVKERARSMALEYCWRESLSPGGSTSGAHRSLWVLVEAQEALLSATYRRGQVRKLQANTPAAVQQNVQNNLHTD
jgi:hypothetical protein